ncbi:MAG: HAD-IB family phosphatase [Desulfurococcaceae archaeon]
MQRKLVIFDCEGVLTEEKSSWGRLHKFFGSKDNEYFANLYRKGLISYLDWMKIDIALMIHSYGRSIKRIDVENALADIKPRRSAKQLIDYIKQRGHLPAVVSSGVDIVVKRICRELGIDICFSNELVFINDELIPGGVEKVPLKEKKKTIVKLAEEYEIGLRNIIYVGDSEWDIEVFETVPLSIAVEPCGIACKHANYIVRDLTEIMHLGVL